MPRPESITFKQLRALRAVSDCGTMTAAADLLSLTPPAVHTQIRGLESALNCRLLESSGPSGAFLTPEGHAVLDAERQIGEVLNTCLDRVRALRDGQSGVVVLGVVSTGKYFAPGLVAKLRDAFPDIDVVLKVGNRDKIISDLQNRAIELAIMGRPPRRPNVTAHELGPHPHVIVAAPDHPLAGQDSVSPDDLLAATFILREQGSGTRILMARYLDRIGEGAPYRQIEMGSNETIKQAVIANLGIAMISQHTVTEEIRAGRLVFVNAPGLPIERHWYLLHRQDFHLPETHQTVRNFVLGLKAEYLPTV